MGKTVRRTIVISAVNIRKGGTLTILRQCLKYLSDSLCGDYNVVALVHDKNLCLYPGIEYMEFPDTIKSWGRRLWCEYVTMNKVSKQLAEKYGSEVYLWFSLHDTTPRVKAEHRAVYCQTSFPFFKWRCRDFKMDFKIPLFAMFTRFAYQVNVHKNDWLVVQADWLREGFSKMLDVPCEKFVVAPPARPETTIVHHDREDGKYQFFYASTPDCHKNFEVLCEAAKYLEEELGPDAFELLLTVKGDENRYAKWLHDRWSQVKSIKWEGYMSKDRLFEAYAQTDCFVFPSRIETWGLPITEFMSSQMPMILSDLPYAHETASGAANVAFFDTSDVSRLHMLMRKAFEKELDNFRPIPKRQNEGNWAEGWEQLFILMLDYQ